MKKFELTTDSKFFYGTKLSRIKALISFGNVSAGDLGGFVEKEGNLSQSGDAWVYGNALVYGNAQVSGDARVYGNAQVSGDARVYDNAQVYGNAQVSGDARVSPINVIGLKWNITITDDDLQIGCEKHSIKDWAKFKDSRIKLMASDVLPWWKSNRDWILKLAKKHQAKAKKVPK